MTDALFGCKHLNVNPFEQYCSNSCSTRQGLYGALRSHELRSIGTEDYFELHGYGDTTTQNDIVRNQYFSLPYPAVSRQDLIAEKLHYTNKKSHIPFLATFAFALESLNHFLYKGLNRFR